MPAAKKSTRKTTTASSRRPRSKPAAAKGRARSKSVAPKTRARAKSVSPKAAARSKAAVRSKPAAAKERSKSESSDSKLRGFHLIRFTVENFFSYKGRQVLDMRQNAKVPNDTQSFDPQDPTSNERTAGRLTKAMVLVGSNASGKTNLLRALDFVHSFMTGSPRFRMGSDVSLIPHVASTKSPSHFQLLFHWNGRRWRYDLSLSRGEKKVLAEELHQSSLERDIFLPLFRRNWDHEKKRYSVKLSKEFDLGTGAAKKNVREDASLISTAAQLNVELAKRIARTQLINSDGSPVANFPAYILPSALGRHFAREKEWHQRADSIIRGLDFGMSRTEVKGGVKKSSSAGIFGGNEDLDRDHELVGVHEIGGREYRIPAEWESAGTLRAYAVLREVFPALRTGGVVLWDEIEAHMHPHVIDPILDLFFSPETNPHNAQIIFTSHALQVLDTLHKSQVTLVEKNERLESEMWRIDEIKGVRADENLYAKYMSGAYGAIPRI